MAPPYWPPPRDGQCTRIHEVIRFGSPQSFGTLTRCAFDLGHGGRHSFEPELVEETECPECGHAYDDDPGPPARDHVVAHLHRLIDELVPKMEHVLWYAKAVREYTDRVLGAVDGEEWADDADREPPRVGMVMTWAEDGTPVNVEPSAVGLAVAPDGLTATWPQFVHGSRYCPKRRTSGDARYTSISPCLMVEGHTGRCSWDVPGVPTAWPPAEVA